MTAAFSGRKKLGLKTRTTPKCYRLVLTTLLGLVVLIPIRHLQRHNHGFHTTQRTCERVDIWSHRTHVDSGRYALGCRLSLELLRKSGIHHFDVDVLMQEPGSPLLLAHPSEVTSNPNTSFQRAPCSNMELRNFLALLKEIYSGEDFYLTMEPKANWPGQAENAVLGEPKVLLDQLLAELPSLISKARCGIILSPDQLLALGQGYDQQIFRACQDLVYPLSIRSPFQLPPTTPYTMFMPTIEHHQEMKSTSSTAPTVVWVVDDEQQLKRALELPNVKGIITNKPQQLQEMLQSMCT